MSTVDAIADAQVSVTLNDGWDDLGLTPALVGLAQDARRARGFGDFWQHCLVAEGALDVAVDAVGVAPYDIAAVRLLVEEAGGTFTDRHGAVDPRERHGDQHQRAAPRRGRAPARPADSATHAARPRSGARGGAGRSSVLDGVEHAVDLAADAAGPAPAATPRCRRRPPPSTG